MNLHMSSIDTFELASLVFGFSMGVSVFSSVDVSTSEKQNCEIFSCNFSHFVPACFCPSIV